MTTDSFSDAIRLEPERFINKTFEENPRIKNYNQFFKAFDKYMKGSSIFSEEDVLLLYDNDMTKNRIKQNTTKEEYEEAYSSDDRIYLQPKTEVNIPTIKVKKSKSGRNKGYIKQEPRPWTKAQIKFIQVRKAKGHSIKQITKEYNDWVSGEGKRTPSSIKFKLQREK